MSEFIFHAVTNWQEHLKYLGNHDPDGNALSQGIWVNDCPAFNISKADKVDAKVFKSLCTEVENNLKGMPQWVIKGRPIVYFNFEAYPMESMIPLMPKDPRLLDMVLRGLLETVDTLQFPQEGLIGFTLLHLLNDRKDVCPHWHLIVLNALNSGKNRLSPSRYDIPLAKYGDFQVFC